MKTCDYCNHVKMCGWRKQLNEQGCEFFDDGIRWIPVSERLPEEKGLYLVTANSTYVVIDMWNENDWLIIKPIAWMPLPKPYRKDKS